jgi:hypothetical protein
MAHRMHVQSALVLDPQRATPPQLLAALTALKGVSSPEAVQKSEEIRKTRKLRIARSGR